jgi:hypothetical protein
MGGIAKELNKELNLDVRNNFSRLKYILSTHGDARYLSVHSFRVFYGWGCKIKRNKK